MSDELLNNVIDTLNNMSESLLDLKRGQDEMNKDIAELKRGQDEMNKEIAELRRGQDEINNDIAELKHGQDELNKDIVELKHGQGTIIKQLGKTMEDVSAMRDEIGELAIGIEFLTHKSAQQERDIFILKKKA